MQRIAPGPAMAMSPISNLEDVYHNDPELNEEIRRANRRSSAASDESDGRGTSPAHGVPQFPFNSQLVRALSAAPELLPASPFKAHEGAADGLPSVFLDLSALPETDRVIALIEHFGSHTNAAFPILHVPIIREQAIKALSGQQIKTVQACIIYLTLAISSRTISKRVSMHEKSIVRSNEYFQKARELLHIVYDASPTLPKLQVRMLHLQFALLSPTHGTDLVDIWELSGAALRLAIDLGCHHERGTVNRDAELDMRRRLFWSAYCVDRNLSIALGRPPGIPDSWINTQLFSDATDDLAVRYLDYPIREGSAAVSATKLTAIHHVRIRQLQSEIQDRLYNPLHHLSVGGIPPQDWFTSIQNRLLHWRQSAPDPMGFCSDTWLDLNYHITLTLLHRPNARNPKPSRESLRITRQASSAVMRSYKEMLKTGRVNWNWLAMYQLFIVGIAYLNSLWQAAEQGWTIVPSYVEALLDMQVCTTVMSSLSAITPGLTSLCSAFEALSEKIIRQLTSRASWSTMSRAPSPDALQLHRLETHANTACDSYQGSIGASSLDPLRSGLDVTLFMNQAGGNHQSQANMGSASDRTRRDDHDTRQTEQVNVNDFLADLGFGNEGPQSTFDHLFMESLPDFSGAEWNWG